MDPTRCRFFALALLLAGPAAASGLEELLDDPAAARDFDYCSWRFDGGGALGQLRGLLRRLARAGLGGERPGERQKEHE